MRHPAIHHHRYQDFAKHHKKGATHDLAAQTVFRTSNVAFSTRAIMTELDDYISIAFSSSSSSEGEMRDEADRETSTPTRISAGYDHGASRRSYVAAKECSRSGLRNRCDQIAVEICCLTCLTPNHEECGPAAPSCRCLPNKLL